MTDEQTTDSLVQRKLDTYRKYNLKANLRELLQAELGLSDPVLDTLHQHTQYMLGHRWTRVDDRTIDLTASQNGMWDATTDLRKHRSMLRAVGLIERRQLHRERTYWVPTGQYLDLLDEKWRYDLGEGAGHRRVVALLKTYYHALKRCNIEAYPTLAPEGTADLLVHVPPPPDYEPQLDQSAARKEFLEQLAEQKQREAAQQRRREMYPPGEQMILIEVMLDHENTQSVLDRFDQLKHARGDGLWIFKNRKTQNKWLRRLQDPQSDGEEPRIETSYTWSPTTPIDTAQERIERLDESAMRSVTTVARVEEWIREYKDRKRMLRRAEPLSSQ